MGMTKLAVIGVAALAWATAPAAADPLTIRLAAEPTAMDPHFHNLTPNNGVATHIFDSLVLQDEKQKLLPGLAVSWKAA